MIATPHQATYSISTISLNPAWRSSLVHLLVVSSFPDGSSQSLTTAVYSDMTHNKIVALRGLSPGTGAYFNEADINEVDWQESFWGGNYGKLREMKERVDGEGVLWCRGCVGSEKWEVREGMLCKTKDERRDEL
jgi:hypothetical protein